MAHAEVPAIAAAGLVRRYGDVPALGGVDLRVSAGQVFALLGPNGAGKTTLLHILTTLMAPDAGTARICGRDVVSQAAEVRRRIAVVFQDTTLDLDLTGAEVLFYHGRIYGMAPDQCRRRMAELEPLMDLGPALARRAKTYSGGMKRRLELARALMTDPQVLFLDEPTLGLDPQNRAAVWDHLHHLRTQRGLTVFLSTHYMEEAERLADQVAIIDGGRVLEQGTPDELTHRLGGDLLHVSGSGDSSGLAHALTDRGICQWAEVHDGHLQVAVPDSRTALAGVVQAALESGYAIAGLTVHRPSLNEVFLKLTGRSLRD